MLRYMYASMSDMCSCMYIQECPCAHQLGHQSFTVFFFSEPHHHRSSSSSPSFSHQMKICVKSLSTVLGPVAVQAGDLASGELLVASIVGVVHVVVDGVKAGQAARVTADGAARRRTRLSGSVGNTVVGAGAATLEGAIELVSNLKSHKSREMTYW